MITQATTIYEPWFGEFTGKLSVYFTKSGHRLTWNKPHPTIRKGQAYVFKFNAATGEVRILTVTYPRWI